MTIPTSEQTVHMMTWCDVLKVRRGTAGRNRAEMKLCATDDLRRIYQQTPGGIARLRDGNPDRNEIVAEIRWRVFWSQSGYGVVLVATLASAFFAFMAWRYSLPAPPKLEVHQGAKTVSGDHAVLTSAIVAVVSLALGAFGWFIAKFLAEPLIAIYALRMEVQEALIRYGNLRPDAPADDRSAAARAFGDVGAKLSAHNLAAWPWVKWACERLRWRIYNAGGCCLELGTEIRERGFSHPNLWALAPVLRDSLRLPPWPKLTDLQRQLGDLLSQPDPSEALDLQE